MVCRRRSPGQERSSIKTEVAVRGFVELRPAEHPVDAYRQPSTKRRSAKPLAATSSSIPARLISRAAMDDEMIPAPRSGFNPLGGRRWRESGEAMAVWRWRRGDGGVSRVAWSGREGGMVRAAW